MASCVDVEVGDGGKIIKIVYLDKPSNVLRFRRRYSFVRRMLLGETYLIVL